MTFVIYQLHISNALLISVLYMFLTDTPGHVQKLKKKEMFKHTSKYSSYLCNKYSPRKTLVKCKQSLMGTEVYEIQDRVQRLGIQ